MKLAERGDSLFHIRRFTIWTNWSHLSIALWSLSLGTVCTDMKIPCRDLWKGWNVKVHWIFELFLALSGSKTDLRWGKPSSKSFFLVAFPPKEAINENPIGGIEDSANGPSEFFDPSNAWDSVKSTPNESVKSVCRSWTDTSASVVIDFGRNLLLAYQHTNGLHEKRERVRGRTFVHLSFFSLIFCRFSLQPYRVNRVVSRADSRTLGLGLVALERFWFSKEKEVFSECLHTINSS